MREMIQSEKFRDLEVRERMHLQLLINKLDGKIQRLFQMINI